MPRRRNKDFLMEVDSDQGDPLASEEDVASGIKTEVGGMMLIPEVIMGDNVKLEGNEDDADDDDNSRGHGATGGLKGSDLINLLSHCVFCLRETRDLKRSSYQKLNADECEVLPLVPKAEDLSFPSSSLLSTLNQFWPYLQQKKNGGDEDYDGGNFPIFEGGGAETFSDLPEMCQFCAEKLESVHKQFVELMRGIKRLGKVVRESKYGGEYSWRAVVFERELWDSNLEADSIQATLDCLGILGKEENDLVRNNETTSISKPRRKRKAKNYALPFDEHETTEPGNVSIDYVGMDNNDSDDKDPVYIRTEPVDESDSFSEFTGNVEVVEEEEDNNTSSSSEEANDSKNTTRKSKRKIVSRTAKLGGTETETKKELFCDLCKYKTTIPRNLIVHRKKTHRILIAKTVRCDLCRDSISCSDLSAHVREHVGDEYCIHCPNRDCPVVYSQPSSMSSHLRSSRNKRCKDKVPSKDLHKFTSKGHTCDTCGLKTGNALVMRGHLSERHETEIKNFTCPVSGCERRFTLRQSVIYHLPHHDFNRNVTTQPCNLCSIYNRINCDQMENHLKVEHGAQEIIKCVQCAFLFSTREALIDHLFEHRYGVLTCDICADGVKFSRHVDLQEHYFKMHQIGKKYVCEECGGGYWKLGLFEDHKQRCRKSNEEEESSDLDNVLPTGKGKRIYKCEECDTVFKSPSTLRDHKVKVHGAEKYRCKFCNQEFSTYDTVRRHEKTHQDLPAKEYRCEVEGCGKTFKQSKGLKRHHSVTHLGIRAHVCETCGKSYTDESGLKSHKDTVHLGLRPAVCAVCGDSFSSGNVLKRHMLIHTGERPFGCDLCGQRFRQREVLKRHLEGHQEKGADFKPNGPMKEIRKRVEAKSQETT